MPASVAILDGEKIVPNYAGGDFTALHSGKRLSDVQYRIFDILWRDGVDLRDLPLMKRKDALSQVSKFSTPSPLQYVEWIEDTGSTRVRECMRSRSRRHHLQTHRRAVQIRRQTDWVKVKCSKRAEYTIVGYVPSTRGRGVEALRLARKNGRKLEYVGKVSTGFSAKSGAEVRAKLEPLMRNAAALTKSIDKPGTVWVEPRYSARVEYLEEVEGGLRHASFKGLADE
ncbi:putative DNA ligase-like protein/MT0965 [Variibacter gotjawalensis]|uniref:DNA ligase (ATP) n=1 Tax=Variibacter gotjawalensis TaxID=1333996 RepID=A0A0S3PX27_9BRAD|nr:hypothetical protein [Variibacter gotjawalensis]NIK46317.1 ATP-dependent DNA ligase [Variibacter gotjawalensis]BAT60488.1 putative DNA ligase-like protein/MT0965 [Variibacter gotjawalensis]